MMEIDRNKAFKLVIVILGTLAALAVMSTLVQLIQTVLPFLIIGGGIYVAYRWALSDAEAPTADEVEEQARGWFDRFRRSKKAVETTVKVGAALQDMGEKADKPRKRRRSVVTGEATKVQAPKTAADDAAAVQKTRETQQEAQVEQVKAKLAGDPGGAIEFKDSDVVISKDDVLQPDISRLEEKEKAEPEVNDSVMEQIEARRRRLHGGG